MHFLKRSNKGTQTTKTITSKHSCHWNNKTLDLLHPSVHRLLAYPQSIQWECSGNKRRAACVRTCYQVPGLPQLLASYSYHSAGRSITAALASQCRLFPALRSDFLWNCMDRKKKEKKERVDRVEMLEYINTGCTMQYQRKGHVVIKIGAISGQLYIVLHIWLNCVIFNCDLWASAATIILL